MWPRARIGRVAQTHRAHRAIGEGLQTFDVARLGSGKTVGDRSDLGGTGAARGGSGRGDAANRIALCHVEEARPASRSKMKRKTPPNISIRNLQRAIRVDVVDLETF